MSRRPFALLALSLAALTLSACADTAAPTAAAPTVRQIQPTGAANHDPVPFDCRGGWSTSTGRAC